MGVLGGWAFSNERGTPVPAHVQGLLTVEDTQFKDTPSRTCPYRVTSLTRNRTTLGPYSRTMPRVLRGS